MEILLSTAVAAAVLFVVTNIDDLFVLVGFFSDRSLQRFDVVVGQVLGIAALVAISLVAAGLSLLLPMPLVGLLGFIPIALGLLQLIRRNDNEAEDAVSNKAHACSSWRQQLMVAVVTIANGGDNIGVYTPVFAVRSRTELMVMIFMFAFMTIAWCVVSYWLVNHRSVGAHIRKFGPRLMPYALIAIGFWVLYEADSVSLLR